MNLIEYIENVFSEDLKYFTSFETFYLGLVFGGTLIGSDALCDGKYFGAIFSECMMIIACIIFLDIKKRRENEMGGEK